jgi:hypothetical protein
VFPTVGFDGETVQLTAADAAVESRIKTIIDSKIE